MRQPQTSNNLSNSTPWNFFTAKGSPPNHQTFKRKICKNHPPPVSLDAVFHVIFLPNILQQSTKKNPKQGRPTNFGLKVTQPETHAPTAVGVLTLDPSVITHCAPWICFWTILVLKFSELKIVDYRCWLIHIYSWKIWSSNWILSLIFWLNKSKKYWNQQLRWSLLLMFVEVNVRFFVSIWSSSPVDPALKNRCAEILLCKCHPRLAIFMS